MTAKAGWLPPGRVVVAALGPPLAVFLVVRLVLWAAAAAEGVNAWSAGAWNRADSGHYLSIAQHGYELYNCATGNLPEPGWCGNTGWLPGYSLLIAALARAGLAAPLAGTLLSGAFTVGGLVIVWAGFLHARRTVANLLTLLLFALFPGSVYQHAIFPMSMCTFFVLLAVWLLLRERWIGAGLARRSGRLRILDRFRARAGARSAAASRSSPARPSPGSSPPSSCCPCRRGSAIPA